MDQTTAESLPKSDRARRSNMWRALAYMLNRTWITTVFFSVVLFQRYAPESMAGAAGAVFRTSVLVLAVALVVFALLHRPVMTAGEHPAFDYMGAMLCGVGFMPLLPYLTSGQIIAPAALWGSAALTGTGSALVFLSIGRRFVGTDVRSCITGLLWATVGCAALTLGIMGLPLEAAVAVEVALPFLCVAALHRIPRPSEEDCDARLSLGERISTKMLLKLATCATVLGILIGITQGLYLGSETAAPSKTFQMLNSAIPLVAALVLLGSTAAAREVTIETLYKPTIFVCIVGFALMPLSNPDIALSFSVVSAGYTLFEILMWVILSEVASRFQFTSVQVFGFGRALALLTGVIAGALIANMLLGLGVGPQLFSAVAAVAVISITFLRTYVLTSTDITVFGQNLGKETDEVSAGAIGEGTLSDNGSQSPSGASAKRAHGQRTESPAGQAPQKVPFQRKCAIIGDYYGLTRREVDVFRLIAAGRNSTRIQEELSISAGTVNTHSHHIFQKLDVHSQQEVIDLFQCADLDRMQAELANRQDR